MHWVRNRTSHIIRIRFYRFSSFNFMTSHKLLLLLLFCVEDQMQDVITPQINILAHVVPLTRPPFTFLCAIVMFMLLCVVCRSDLLLQTYVSWMRTESCGWLIRAWRRPSGLTVFLSMMRLPFFTGKDVTRWFSSLTFLSHTSFLSHQSVYFDCLLIICLPYCFCHTLHRVL